MKPTLLLIPLSLFIAACSDSASEYSSNQFQQEQERVQRNSWYTDSQQDVVQIVETLATPPKAKNVILFIGDGMGISTITAARIMEGQNRGESGEENRLSFEDFPFTGLSKTYNTNQQVPDSAGTMTAITTGLKTKAGVIALDESASRASCNGVTESRVPNLLELAELSGMRTGLVTTTRITHATPAASYAHSPERDWEADSDMPASALDAGCTDIAQQLVQFDIGDGLDVVLGGGLRSFYPADQTLPVEDKMGERADQRHLINEWLERHPRGLFFSDATGLEDAVKRDQLPVMGLFSASHMNYESDRPASQPSLATMTQSALQLLGDRQEGFVLIVEAGRIDHAHHAGNPFNALNETIQLSNAVQVAREMTSSEETLILVTADHGHVFTLGGYPTRGNPILGKVRSNDDFGVAKEVDELAEDGLPYTTVGYTNGAGFADLGMATDSDERYLAPTLWGRVDLSEVETRNPGFYPEALIPLESESHSGEDVAVYADGPGAMLISGTREQNHLFHVINQVLQLTERAADSF